MMNIKRICKKIAAGTFILSVLSLVSSAFAYDNMHEKGYTIFQMFVGYFALFGALIATVWAIIFCMSILLSDSDEYI